jgi:hypothetical protein
MDHSAIIAQVSRIASHGGAGFSWAQPGMASEVHFSGFIESDAPSYQNGAPGAGVQQHVRITAPVEAFAPGQYPRVGSILTDRQGTEYRVILPVSRHEGRPALIIICEVT